MSESNLTPELVRFLQEQKDRQDIHDCLVRYCRGMDRFDRELMASAYHPDAWDDHGLKSAYGVEFCAWAIDFHRRIQRAHQHFISNHHVELDGDSAHAETYFHFWGENLDGSTTLAFGRYIDRFEKRDGVWAIAYRRCITEKVGSLDAADVYVETGERRAATGPSRRDRRDASYARPLERSTPNE